MAKSNNRWIETAWTRAMIKEENAIVMESIKTMEEVGVRLRFKGRSIRLDNEVIDEEREWKPAWHKIKTSLQKATEAKRIEIYRTKEQQSQFYQEQEEECHVWLSQNLHGRKTSSIMTMLERWSRRNRGRYREDWPKIDGAEYVMRDETVEHIVAGCKVLANNEYLTRHNSFNDHGNQLGQGIQISR